MWGYGIQFVCNEPTVPTSTLPPINQVSETFIIRHVLAKVNIDHSVQNGCESNILQFCTVRIVEVDPVVKIVRFFFLQLKGEFNLRVHHPEVFAV